MYPGAERPFSRDRVRSARDIHGESGIDGSDLLPSLSVAVGKEDEDGSGGSMMMMGSAILAMREAILAQARGEVWIVATGAWTNVALLFAGFPDVADWVAGVSLMGGAVGDGFSGAKMGSMSDRGVWEGRVGNTTPWAEFNVFVSFLVFTFLLSLK